MVPNDTGGEPERDEHMPPHQVQSALSLNGADYSHALVHLAWLIVNGQRYLVFGMVELFPSELPEPDETPELSWQYRSGSKRILHRIYVKRSRMPLKEAMHWYSDCRTTGRIVLPADDDKDTQGNDKVLAIAKFHEEPTWPYLIAQNDLPFVSTDWRTVRVHHLVQIEKLQAICLLRDDAEAMTWFADRLYFKIADRSQWLGSLHLVAPNPVCRYIDHRLGQSPEGEPTSQIRFVGRAGAEQSDMHMQIEQLRQCGMLNSCSFPVSQPYSQLPQPVPIWSIGHVLTCPVRGVLDWFPPSLYTNRIQVQTSFVTEQRQVEVPAPPGESREIHNVQRLTAPRTMEVGETATHESVAEYLERCRIAQRRRQLAEERGEKWFHGNQEEARDLVRALVSAARRRVWIIDPYFATVELFRFALAVSTEGVKTFILTGTERLKEDQRLVPGSAILPGEILLNEIDRLPAGDSVEVKIMTGSKPIVHDRFLVIDDDLWFSGNSLHSLGDRASMMVKITDPSPIISELEAIMAHRERVVKLRTWVTRQREALRSKRHGQSQEDNVVNGTANGVRSQAEPQESPPSKDASNPETEQ